MAENSKQLIDTAKGGNVTAVRELLAAGADRTIVNEAGQSAHDVAASDEIRTLLSEPSMMEVFEELEEQEVGGILRPGGFINTIWDFVTAEVVRGNNDLALLRNELALACDNYDKAIPVLRNIAKALVRVNNPGLAIQYYRLKYLMTPAPPTAGSGSKSTITATSDPKSHM